MKQEYFEVGQIVNTFGIKGFVKVILPLGFIFIAALWLRNKAELLVNNLSLFIESLIVIMFCESVAICVNPLPKWAFENNVEGFVDVMSSAIKKSKEE